MSTCPAIEEAKRRISRRQFRTKLADEVELSQPLTLESLAGKLTASIAEVDLEIGYGDMCVSYRTLKRWNDHTPYGRGREFLGTVGTLGFTEPDEPEPIAGVLPPVDPRTLLAMIRASRSIRVELLASRFDVCFDTMMESIRQLVYAGHVYHSRVDKEYFAVMASKPPRQRRKRRAWAIFRESTATAVMA